MTRHLIVGAGASLAECKAAQLPDELCLPLISNFCRKMWVDYNPASFLEAYLTRNGIDLNGNDDPRDKFFELEESRPFDFNVERFFEYAWTHRNEFPGEWENLTYHGILNPLVFLLSQGLWKNGLLNAPLKLSPQVAAKLEGRDVVLDLNYDTLFEIGLHQAGKPITFIPNIPSDDSISVVKPHGSINMIVDVQKRSFCFGNLDWPGNPQPEGRGTNSAGFIPPRLNKTFSDHPAAKMIIAPVANLKPETLTFWGIGFTKSDLDLMALYRAWAQSAERIEVINPDASVATAIKAEVGCAVFHYPDLNDWLAVN